MINIIFGVIYGGIISGTYLLAKHTGSKGGVDVVCISTFILFLIHIIIWPKLTILAFKDYRNIIRGALFGLAQIFLFKAQSYSPTSTMLIASIAGAISGAWFGKIILKEKHYFTEVLAIILALFGIFIGSNFTFDTNIWAIIGGIIQGFTGITARSLMQSKVSKRGAVSSGFLIISVFMFIYLYSINSINALSQASYKGVIIVGLFGLVSQYAFFYLYKIYSNQKAVVFTLLRVPWGVVLEAIILASPIMFNKILSSIIVFIAALLALYNPRVKK